ncbi:NRDE family protein [Spongiactinospora sp. TRM90649]|uniref:NRDE family protein n=1 Tax=Spongiactinospora sp. TRM90649 TaxID=3031114 RepID=UPI0023F77F9E|nr:NRDE family protein [Spongiactinospora sp. TRM90649]MDF5753785.1 NRDE family protein [Spongiactinospora sp. TRM90649]
MCTVVVDFAPDSAVPGLLAGVRDEFAGRPWEPPGEHWPGRPGVLGGLDLRAGGTWLAVDPARDRAAALLNGRGLLAVVETRRSRGDLPLLAVEQDGMPDVDPTAYDPFHLVVANPTGVRLWHWDGERLSADDLPPGTHVIVNSGWERGEDNRRVAHFRPRFAAARRPGRPDASDPAEYWDEWLGPASGDGLDPGDPRALVVRERLPGGQVWGTSSITLLGLAPGAVRYDFSDRPGDPEGFRRVLPKP